MALDVKTALQQVDRFAKRNQSKGEKPKDQSGPYKVTVEFSKKSDKPYTYSELSKERAEALVDFWKDKQRREKNKKNPNIKDVKMEKK